MPSSRDRSSPLIPASASSRPADLSADPQRFRQSPQPVAADRKFALLGVLLGCAVLCLVLIPLAIAGWKLTSRPEFAVDGKPYQIELIGDSEGWQARYPGNLAGTFCERVTRSGELHLPAGTPILLLLKTREVACLLKIPERGLKQIAVPGRVFPLKLPAEDLGELSLVSSPGCGPTQEPVHKRIIVEPQDRFAQWWLQLPKPANAKRTSR